MRTMRVALGFQLLFVIGLLLLPACSTRLQPPVVSPALVESERQRQKEEALRLYFERGEQVARVASLVAAKNVELCEDQTEPRLGIFWADKRSLPEEYWDAAKRSFGVAEDLRVLAVVPGFPAEAAGVKPGDIVLKINGSEVNSSFGLRIFDLTPKDDHAREMIRKKGMEPVNLEIKRAGETLMFPVKPVTTCSFSVKVEMSDRVNASTDGKNIAVTTGMLRFLKSDDELAIALGHELAHNIMSHATQNRGTAIAGGFLGLLLDVAAAAGGVNTGGVFTQWGSQAGLLMFSQDYEREADYLGLYFAARAGFEVSKAPDLWRRMAVEHPGSIKENFLATHPSSAERAVTLEASVKEINKKVESEEALLPAIKNKNKSWWETEKKARTN